LTLIDLLDRNPANADAKRGAKPGDIISDRPRDFVGIRTICRRTSSTSIPKTVFAGLGGNPLIDTSHREVGAPWRSN
jgi:hypothetical protein